MNLKLLFVIVCLICQVYQIKSKVVKNSEKVLENSEKEISSKSKINIPNAKLLSDESRKKMCKLWCDNNWYHEHYSNINDCYKACCNKYGCSYGRIMENQNNNLNKSNLNDEKQSAFKGRQMKKDHYEDDDLPDNEDDDLPDNEEKVEHKKINLKRKKNPN